MAEAPRRALVASLRQMRVTDWGLEPPGVLEIRNSRSYSYRVVGASKFQLRDKVSRAAGLSKGAQPVQDQPGVGPVLVFGWAGRPWRRPGRPRRRPGRRVLDRVHDAVVHNAGGGPVPSPLKDSESSVSRLQKTPCPRRVL